MIHLSALAKRFGATQAITDFSLEIAEGEFAVLVGPSGCGKSTILRLINAMLQPDSGRIEIRGLDIRKARPEILRRGIGYVIQSIGLFPHWTISENILAVPRLQHWSSARCKARLSELVDMFEIDPVLLRRFPRQLSGGEQQRVGVARALAAEPDIVLMDEPFAALDPVSRANLRDGMRRIHKQSEKTIVFVTHDMDEALKLATRIAVMKAGRLMQAGTASEILLDPNGQFVRDFLGGADLPFRLLECIAVGACLRQADIAGQESGSESPTESISAAANLKEALCLMLAHRQSTIGVYDEKGSPLGSLHIDDILRQGSQ
jgi:osmoprotectant transport system ATP-binding protein